MAGVGAHVRNVPLRGARPATGQIIGTSAGYALRCRGIPNAQASLRAVTPSQVPTGFVPFNVQNINGNIYVTYAPPGRDLQTKATPGMGAVAIFNENGQFQRMAAGGVPLAAPWGLALAPAGFGLFSGDLRSFSSSAVAVATSREGRRSPRSGRAVRHRQWDWGRTRR